MADFIINKWVNVSDRQGRVAEQYWRGTASLIKYEQGVPVTAGQTQNLIVTSKREGQSYLITYYVDLKPELLGSLTLLVTCRGDGSSAMTFNKTLNVVPNGILYDGKVYDYDVIKSVNTIREKSMVGEECSVNTLTAELYSDDLGEHSLLTVFGEYYAPIGYDAYTRTEGSDIRNYTPFAPLELWKDAKLLGKYYLTSVERTARNWFKLSACSPIGIVDKMIHKGGLYNQATFSAICADIIGNAISYTVDAAIASIPITGWLPYGSARDNLQQLLFAAGAAATYGTDGNMVFKYNEPDVSVAIPDAHLYQGGSIGYPSKASKVTLIEHAWYLDTNVNVKTLYDNTGQTAADNALIVFDGPYHTLVGSGLTVTPINCNCCYVTGTGTLTGKPYAHTRRELVQQDPTLVAGEKRVENATLVSSLNSLNTLRRVYNYLRNANEISYGIVNDGSFKPGDLVNFTDPFGDPVTGYVKEMTENISGIIKSTTKIATNWVPKYLGNTYEHSMILKESDLEDGTWSVPEAMQGNPAMVVLFGGFGGGQGGGNGASGQGHSSVRQRLPFNGEAFEGGAGGSAGTAGAYPKYKVIEYETLASSYSVSFGQGGAGGVAGGGAGSAGGNSFFGAYSTGSGDTLAGEYVNLLTGEVVASKGDDGFVGGSGGRTPSIDEAGLYLTGSSGDNVGANTGGAGISGWYDWDTDEYRLGASGGGAAYGANGSNAVRNPNYPNYATGGNGASATAPAYVFAKTGAGGNGGGGGGGGGINGYYGSDGYYHWQATGGDGGSGSGGGQGSQGFALIYY